MRAPAGGTIDLGDSSKLHGHSFLKPGDYIANKFEGRLMVNGKGAFRLFLVDRETSSDSYVLKMSTINGVANDSAPAELQIWYNGIQKLSVGNMSALIYAPNARVEIERGKCFAGAIVASGIVFEGNNRVALDTSLCGLNFK